MSAAQSYEFIAVRREEYEKDSNISSSRPTLLVQITLKEINHPQVVYGKITASSFAFCQHHEVSACDECNSDSACGRCRFKYFCPTDFPSRPLVFKFANYNTSSAAKKIYAEAEFQQRLHAVCAENVPSCVGNYTNFCYFIRKHKTSDWRAVKISLCVERYSLMRSAVVSRQSSQTISSQTTVDALVGENSFKEDVSKIRRGLSDLAISYNVHSTVLNVNYADDDFQKQNNVFLSTSETTLKNDHDDDERVPRYVFVDFGNNIAFCPVTGSLI